MKYLTAGQILLIHSMVIDETGGTHGVRDFNVVRGLEQLPQQKVFGKELYPTIFVKAAVYVRAIIMNHPFIDGNKRAGMTAAVIFLENNGYQIAAKEGEIERFALEIVKERHSLEILADWFKKHSRKQRK